MAQRKRAKWSLLEQRTAVQQAAASHELFLVSYSALYLCFFLHKGVTKYCNGPATAAKLQNYPEL